MEKWKIEFNKLFVDKSDDWVDDWKSDLKVNPIAIRMFIEKLFKKHNVENTHEELKEILASGVVHNLSMEKECGTNFLCVELRGGDAVELFDTQDKIIKFCKDMNFLLQIKTTLIPY